MLGAQVTSSQGFPIIDTHIHLFDKTRPQGAPDYPSDMPGGGEPPQGMIAVPGRYKAIVSPFGVTGAIVVEASTRVEDNQWLLDQAALHPIIVGVVGRIDAAGPGFGKQLERFCKNRLFIGIRQYQLNLALEQPTYLANLKMLADADCSLDVTAYPRQERITEVILRVLDRVPSLRLILDHVPNARFPDDSAKQEYVHYLRQLGERPRVSVKLSEVVQKLDDKVSTDLNVYKDWLDEIWAIFGEDRVMFGSDWPQSESLEYNSYPHVMSVARAFVQTKGTGVMEKVFWKNSMKLYRWVQREPSQRKG
jgi:predicted TIM-barrel fold metal-dependent hydrolase